MSILKFRSGFRPVTLDQHSVRLAVPTSWQCPMYLDNRPYMLPADDQGKTSMCAAYAMAGLIEAHNWRTSHIPSPIDAPALYRLAKDQFDKTPDEGTTFDAVFRAAQTLNLLPATASLQYLNSLSDIPFAIHKHGLVLAGFNVAESWYATNPGGWIFGSGDTLGGHAVLLCWFDRNQGVGFQNSWSDRWGVNGFGRLGWATCRDQFLQASVVNFA